MVYLREERGIGVKAFQTIQRATTMEKIQNMGKSNEHLRDYQKEENPEQMDERDMGDTDKKDDNIVMEAQVEEIGK